MRSYILHTQVLNLEGDNDAQNIKHPNYNPPEGDSMVIGDPPHEIKFSTWKTADWTVPAISDAGIQVAGVEALEVLI